ncbi:MAG: hypothetical protein JWR42_2879 [Marmoricola sp.]|nr:hypothetical protein [Marmoricola sp.]
MSDDLIRLAVLIDADNTSPKMTREMFEELAGYGTLTVKRAYGDWTNDRLRGWKGQLHKHAISPIQQFANTSGKNATDSALIIDAMDLLYAGHLDGFVIVSSDADFTRLATRLRESGKVVYGVGQRKTPKPFQDACDKFTFLEVLRDPDSEPDTDGNGDAGDQGSSHGSSTESGRGSSSGSSRSESPRQASTGDEDVAPVTRGNLQSKLTKALNKMPGDDDNWATVGALSNHLNRTDPSFDPRTYDFAKLSDLVKAQPYLETKSVQGAGGRSELWARIKGARPAGQPGREQSGREQSGREQPRKDEQARDQSQKAPSGKEQAPRDQAPRDQAPRDQLPKDQPAKAPAAREQSAQDETAPREPVSPEKPSRAEQVDAAEAGGEDVAAERPTRRRAPVVKVTTSTSEARLQAEDEARAKAQAAVDAKAQAAANAKAKTREGAEADVDAAAPESVAEKPAAKKSAAKKATTKKATTKKAAAKKAAPAVQEPAAAVSEAAPQAEKPVESGEPTATSAPPAATGPVATRSTRKRATRKAGPASE